MIKKIKDYFNKNKQEKLKKQIKNKRSEYDKLKIKFDEGIINNSELNKYYKLKEELNKMAKKFMMKDGKLVLNSEDDNNQESKVQESKVQEPKEEEQKVQEPEQEQPQEQVKEPMVQQPKVEQPKVQEPTIQKPQNDEQLYARMKHEEQLKEEQARQEYLRRQQLQQSQMQERMRMQQAQRAQAQQSQAQAQQLQPKSAQAQQELELLTLSVFVQDMPVLTTVIYANVADKVINDIREARRQNQEFRLGAYFIIANKIIGYKFDEYDPKELEQRGGN